MKKIFLIITLFILSTCLPIQAAIKVESVSSPVITQNLISQNIKVVVSALLRMKSDLSVTALNGYIENVANPNAKIPITDLYVVDDEGTSFQMQNNVEVEVANGKSLFIESKQKYYTLQVRDMGVLEPGTYVVNLQFKLKGYLCVDTDIYTLSFTIPVEQTISTNQNPVNITLTPDDVFDTTSTVYNEGTLVLNIQSNTNWNLSLDTSVLNNTIGDYYFQILSANNFVTDFENTPIKLEANQIYDIAKGTKTATDSSSTIENAQLFLKYYLKNSTSNYFKEGIYTNFAKYVLNED